MQYGRRYRVAVDVKRAADLYAQGRTDLRQIGAELGVTVTMVSHQLRRAGITMRRGAPAHPASTQQILELRDRGLTWNEVAEQVGMTVFGAWSHYRRARPPDSPRLGRWQQVLADALGQNLAIGVRLSGQSDGTYCVIATRSDPARGPRLAGRALLGRAAAARPSATRLAPTRASRPRRAHRATTGAAGKERHGTLTARAPAVEAAAIPAATTALREVFDAAPP